MTTGWMLFVGAAAGLAAVLCGWVSPRLWLAATIAGGLAALVAAVHVSAGGSPWDWHSQFRVCGEPLHLRLDGVSSVFLALLAVLGALGAVYAREYWGDDAHPRSAGQAGCGGACSSSASVRCCCRRTDCTS